MVVTRQARKMRKALGGAMRQVGVLAAAGLVALKKTLPRITDDHEHAKKLARGLAAVPGLKVGGGLGKGLAGERVGGCGGG